MKKDSATVKWHSPTKLYTHTFAAGWCSTKTRYYSPHAERAVTPTYCCCTMFFDEVDDIRKYLVVCLIDVYTCGACIGFKDTSLLHPY